MLLRLQRLLKGLFGAIVWEFVGGFLLEWCLLGSGWMEFSVVVRSCFGSCAFGIVVFIFSSSFSSFLFSMENPCDVSNVFSTLENDNFTIIFFRFDLTKKRELKR